MLSLLLFLNGLLVHFNNIQFKLYIVFSSIFLSTTNLLHHAKHSPLHHAWQFQSEHCLACNCRHISWPFFFQLWHFYKCWSSWKVQVTAQVSTYRSLASEWRMHACSRSSTTTWGLASEWGAHSWGCSSTSRRSWRLASEWRTCTWCIGGCCWRISSANATGSSMIWA